MAVKIRLQRHGRRKAPFYHIVIADSRSPRDGKFIEKIGTYNPMTVPATIELDRDSAFDWLQKGAQPTDTVTAILRFKGVMYRKHLQRGVNKGAVTTEQAAERYEAFVQTKKKQSVTAFLKRKTKKLKCTKQFLAHQNLKKLLLHLRLKQLKKRLVNNRFICALY